MEAVAMNDDQSGVVRTIFWHSRVEERSEDGFIARAQVVVPELSMDNKQNIMGSHLVSGVKEYIQMATPPDSSSHDSLLPYPPQAPALRSFKPWLWIHDEVIRRNTAKWPRLRTSPREMLGSLRCPTRRKHEPMFLKSQPWTHDGVVQSV